MTGINESLLKKLAERLALNMVSCSFPSAYGRDPFDEIFVDNMTYRERTRNILVIGAGATHNLSNAIPLANKFADILKNRFDEKYGLEFYDRIVSRELSRLTNIYKLNQDDFETQLAAYSRFDKDLVLDVLTETYKIRYPVSLFYEIVAHLFKHRFIDVIINFNFDEILDNAIDEEMNSNEYKFIYSDGHSPEKGEEANEFIKSGKLRIPIYIKPHGTISHASTLRFTRRDYYNLPARLRDTLKFLLAGTTDDDGRWLHVNLLVVGFGLNSFELNRIISEAQPAKNCSLYYFDSFTADALNNFVKKRRPKDLEAFTNENSFLFNISISNKKDDDSLDNIFFRLWGYIMSLYKPAYSPKNVTRHVIVAELFNPIAKKLLLSPTIDRAEQKKNLAFYFLQRLFVELSIEIYNCNDGILNMTHIRQGRVGKYYNLYREYGNHLEPIFTYIEQLGLQRYKAGVNDTWYFEPAKDFKNEVHQRVLNKLANAVRVHANDSSASEKLTKAVAEVKEKSGKFLNIIPSFFENRISIFQSINEDSLINTDIKWIYKFKKYFYNKKDLDKWDIVLSISETGKVFAEDRIVQALGAKKIVLICSYNSKEGRDEKRTKLLGQLDSIRGSFLTDETNEPVLKLLPHREHNQHIVLFCKVQDARIQPVYGIYYERRLMSRKVSPVAIEPGNETDLRMLFSIFSTYFERAGREEQLGRLEKSVKQLQEYFSNNQSLNVDQPSIKYLLSTPLEKQDVEKFLVQRYLENKKVE